MSRQKPAYAENTWNDVAQAVEGWEKEYGVTIEARLLWQLNLSTGGYVEVIIYDGHTVGRGPELVRVRNAFPARKMSGQAGAVMWAVFAALRALEADKWQWSTKMRRAAQETA